tara:strand:- start:29 stop:577 length:549 start_codon:yes stop_codon:yes gene_type:complete
VSENYKATRAHCEEAGAHFELVRKEGLLDHPTVSAQLAHAGLEGDDCIALTVEEIRKKRPDAIVTIVSSDGDFKQLLAPNVRLVDLKGNMTGGEGDAISPELELFCRIVAGDCSDNIQSVFPRCGRKTAQKLFHDQAKFTERLISSPCAAGTYERNRLLIDFKRIPAFLAAGFRRERLHILE